MRLFVFSAVTSVVLFACPAVPAEDAGLPEEFQKMVRHLDSAKTLQVSVRSTVDGMATWKSRITASGENRLRLHMSVAADGQPKSRNIEFISNGKSLETILSGQDPQISDAHPRLKDRLQKSLSRCGFLFTYLTPVGSETDDAESLSELITVHDCELTGTEQSDGRKLLVFSYDFVLETSGQTVSCRVWIDQQTHLPARRTFTMRDRLVTETYSDWQLNKPVPAGTFDVTERS